ncbi:MAG: hypothetical protein K6F32_00785 [Bacilli bacterium]|nr:hypothetical protein [Bacilli bacterium]
MRTAALENFKNIESEFYDLNEGECTAKVHLRFASPRDIFDANCLSKIPVFSDDFDEWLVAALKNIPARYKLELEVEFADMGEYTEEEMGVIFRKNLLLSIKNSYKESSFRNKIAFSLIAAGVVAFVGMMLIESLWVTESFWHTIFFYILDIAVTVLFWEAAGVLLVENRERRQKIRNYRDRVAKVSFIQGAK